MDSKNVIKNLCKYMNEEFATLVEESIKKFSQEYADDNNSLDMIEPIYESKYVEIMNVLKLNPKIVKDKEFALKLAFLKDKDLNPDKYKDILRKKEIEEYKKNEVKGSDTFQCPTCKKSNCKITEKQTRAGDEPATTYVECLHCGNKFTF